MRRINALFLLLVVVISALGAVAPGAAQEPASSARANRIQQDLRQILSGPEFSTAPAGESMLQRAGRWIQDKWDRFSRWLNRLFSFGGRASAGTSQFIMWIVLAGLILGIAALLAYAVRRYGLGQGKGLAMRSLKAVSEEIDEQIDDPDSLLVAARQLAADGQYRRAYRATFLAILLRMDRMELIRFDRSRTNGEYLRSLRSRPEILSWIRPIADDFDLRWYGGMPVGESEFRRLITAYDRLAPAAVAPR